MNEFVDVSTIVSKGSFQLFEYGVLGIVFVFSLILNVTLGTLLWRTRSKRIEHLEKKNHGT